MDFFPRAAQSARSPLSRAQRLRGPAAALRRPVKSLKSDTTAKEIKLEIPDVTGITAAGAALPLTLRT
jgi:hypothetical protein